MKPLTLALLAFAFAPLPLAAQSLHDTHDMRWAPSGKTPSVTWHYRGADRQRTAENCRAAATPIHLSGKTVMAATSQPDACGTQLAQATPQGAVVARD
ncbi:hypothetical protein U1839_24065 [Sphingomonas sp. RT2P30]|uniref:hypothetical protein n=1 Tax=Parasphingomonas halimpatiens TaxID=3096162 RepID=UPI002FC62D8A